MENGTHTVCVPAGDGLTLAAEGFGNDGNPVVLLAHGGGQCRHVWADTAARLAASGYHVFTLDSRGHGDSDWPDPPRYEPDDFARDFEAAARWRLEVDGRPPHYVGASLSGLAGLIAAGLLNQAAFASLTLVDVTPTYNEDALLKARTLFARTAEEGFATEAEAARATGVAPGSAQLGKMLRREAGGRWRWRWDPAFAECINHDERTQRRCKAAAQALSLPVHLVRAGRSEFVDDETTAAFLALTRHLQVTILPDARHVVTGDPEGIYANAILTFLDGVSGRR
jgi:pimeloyl-ACP methyl ester carboxylesterase